MTKLAAHNAGKYEWPDGLGIRLMLDFELSSMGCQYHSPSHCNYVISSAPLEPVIAKAATQGMVSNCLIQMDQRGTTLHSFATPIPVMTFFSALLTEQHTDNLKKCCPDSQLTGLTFEEAFADAYGMFTQDWCISDTITSMALFLNMVISCQEGLLFMDLCILFTLVVEHFCREMQMEKARDDPSSTLLSSLMLKWGMVYSVYHNAKHGHGGQDGLTKDMLAIQSMPEAAVPRSMELCVLTSAIPQFQNMRGMQLAS
ncbi:hypothetical protein L208DRAFT_1374468 [Tricholoma matsutake]|nr:hypothetical protein L208DRAFT_1374468 [Tricholoma matsutake 945]